jgi:hypothetical protein
MDVVGWENELKRKISELNPDIDVEFGAVYDLIIRPMAQILSDIDIRMGYIESLLDASRWNELDDEEVELLAKNYGLVRRDGTKASCVVTFYAIRKPAGKVIIPEGFVVSTTDGIKFLTTQRVEVLANEVDNYRNTVTGRYEFPVQVIAMESGMKGNVAQGTITVMSQGLRYIDGCVNKISASGGSEIESNAQLIDRIKGAVRGGYSSSTLDSLKYSLLVLFDSIADMSIEKVSPVIEGTVDVYYKGVELETVVEKTYWYGLDIYLKNRPVREVVRVASGAVEYQQGVDWMFVKDVTSAWRGTDKARDRIVWISNNRPGTGAEVTIEYVYNRLGKRLVDWAKYDENRFIEPIVMYREAVAVAVEMEADVRLYKGYGSATIESIKDVIYAYVNSDLMLGQSLEVADVIEIVMSKVKGIDNIVFRKFCRLGEDKVEDLSIEKSQYFTVSRDNIRLNRV